MSGPASQNVARIVFRVVSSAEINALCPRPVAASGVFVSPKKVRTRVIYRHDEHWRRPRPTHLFTESGVGGRKHSRIPSASMAEVGAILFRMIA